MKIFKAVNLNGTFKNTTNKYLLLIHFSLNLAGSISLKDENGVIIENFNNSGQNLDMVSYGTINATENTSNGAITYDPFTGKYSYGSSFINKTCSQKILIPPNYSISNISAGLFIELDNLEELKGLI